MPCIDVGNLVEYKRERSWAVCVRNIIWIRQWKQYQPDAGMYGAAV